MRLPGQPEAAYGSGHGREDRRAEDRKSTRLNSSHPSISYAVFCLKKKKTNDLKIIHVLNQMIDLLLRVLNIEVMARVPAYVKTACLNYDEVIHAYHK